MFTVYFRNSTTTPAQPGLRTLVDAAIGDCEARWSGEEAELILPDGALVYLFGEDQEDGMLLEYPKLTESVANLVHAVAARTNAFVLDDLFEPSAVRTADNVGEIRAADMSMRGYLTLDGPLELQSWLSENPANVDLPPARQRMPPPNSKSSSEERNLLGKLADALFGKKI